MSFYKVGKFSTVEKVWDKYAYAQMRGKEYNMENRIIDLNIIKNCINHFNSNFTD